MEVETNYIKLKVPHERGKLSFQHPAFKGTYGSVAQQIDKSGLKRPTSPETASLVYDAFQNKDGKYESEIISILRSNWFWEFTGNFYLPKSNEEISNGVILEHNPKITNGKLVMDKNSLIKKLGNAKEIRINKHPIFVSEDELTKFVPFGYKIGKQSSLELLKNPYIIARYGEEGAEKIAKVADKYSSKPYLCSFDSVDEEKVRMSALGWGWVFDDGLYVDGNGGDDYYRGR